MLAVFDHILAALLIAILPAYATFEYRRLKARRARLREQGLPADNVPEYRWTIALQWGLTALMIGIWLWRSSAWRDLGLVVPPERSLWSGWGFALIAALTLVAVILLLMQGASIRRSASTRESVRKQIVSVRDMLPSTPRELNWFYGLSVTAGICEELLYRGFMLWYLSHAMSMWAAIPLSALIFGIAHAYQGPSGIAKTGPVGLIMAAMYVVSGSLWLPMLLHAAIDVLNGRMIFDALTMDGDAPKKPAEPEPVESPRYDQPHASAGPSTGETTAGGATNASHSFSAQNTPYAALGGDEAVRALVTVFYNTMEREQAFAGIRALHKPSLHEAREKLYEFLCGWLGGPELYVQKYGHPRLRGRHMPFPIGESERDLWLTCMKSALDERGIAGEIRAFLDQRFAHVANFLRNVQPPSA